MASTLLNPTRITRTRLNYVRLALDLLPAVMPLMAFDSTLHDCLPQTYQALPELPRMSLPPTHDPLSIAVEVCRSCDSRHQNRRSAKEWVFTGSSHAVTDHLLRDLRTSDHTVSRGRYLPRIMLKAEVGDTDGLSLLR